MSQQSGTAESEIRALIEAWADAVRRHDLPGILAHHDRDIMMFDVPLPLQSLGMTEYKKTWELFFRYHEPSQAFDIEQLTITAGEDVAFAVAVVQCGSATVSGPPEAGGFLFRLTIGLRKIDGEWRITHEHHSVPTIDVAAKLKEHFEAAALWLLEAAELRGITLTHEDDATPGTELTDEDGETPGFDLSDEDSATVDLFNMLAETVDAIPIELLRSSEELRETNPRNYQKILESFIPYVGTQYKPKDAAEFLEKLNGYVRLYATNPELFKSGAAG